MQPTRPTHEALLERSREAVIDTVVPLWDHITGARMHVVSHKAIRLFCGDHPQSRGALDHWYRVAKRATWSSFSEVKQSFNTADFVAPYIVFDIGGNKYRLIAEMNFARSVVFIRGIMTHKEYVKGGWKS